MPFARIDDTLEMYYEDDAFTDPWRRPETVVLHHGNAKNARLWPAAGPAVPRGAAGSARVRAFHRAARGLRLVACGQSQPPGGVGTDPAANPGESHQGLEVLARILVLGGDRRQPPGLEREPPGGTAGVARAGIAEACIVQ